MRILYVAMSLALLFVVSAVAWQAPVSTAPDFVALEDQLSGPGYVAALRTIAENFSLLHEEDREWLVTVGVDLARDSGHRRVAGFGLLAFAAQKEAGLAGRTAANEIGAESERPLVRELLLASHEELVAAGMRDDDRRVVANAILLTGWLEPDLQLPARIMSAVSELALQGENTDASDARSILARNGTVAGFGGLVGALKRTGQEDVAVEAMADWLKYADDAAKDEVVLREEWALELLRPDAEIETVARAARFLSACNCTSLRSEAVLESVLGREDLAPETREVLVGLRSAGPLKP